VPSIGNFNLEKQKKKCIGINLVKKKSGVISHNILKTKKMRIFYPPKTCPALLMTFKCRHSLEISKKKTTLISHWFNVIITHLNFRLQRLLNFQIHRED